MNTPRMCFKRRSRSTCALAWGGQWCTVQKGAVLVEFAMAIPLLLILIFGAIEAGRTISSVAWISQTSYESAIAGAESFDELGETKMEYVRSSFEHVLNRDMDGIQFQGNRYEELTVGGETIPIVRARIHGNLLAITDRFDFSLDVEMVAPHVAYNQGVPQDLGNFKTWDDKFYDCAGEICGCADCGPCPTEPCGLLTATLAGTPSSPASAASTVTKVQYGPVNQVRLVRP